VEKPQDRHNFPEVVASAGRYGHNLPEVVPILAAKRRAGWPRSGALAGREAARWLAAKRRAGWPRSGAPADREAAR
jgi:hypothetical protein